MGAKPWSFFPIQIVKHHLFTSPTQVHPSCSAPHPAHNVPGPPVAAVDIGWPAGLLGNSAKFTIPETPIQPSGLAPHCFVQITAESGGHRALHAFSMTFSMTFRNAAIFHTTQICASLLGKQSICLSDWVARTLCGRLLKMYAGLLPCTFSDGKCQYSGAP